MEKVDMTRNPHQEVLDLANWIGNYCKKHDITVFFIARKCEETEPAVLMWEHGKHDEDFKMHMCRAIASQEDILSGIAAATVMKITHGNPPMKTTKRESEQ